MINGSLIYGCTDVRGAKIMAREREMDERERK